MALTVFYSYCHKDEALRDELEKHLSLLRRSGVITNWHDRRIGAGEEWRGEIDGHLNTADVVLLLISSDFLASDYCYDVEMKRAMSRHEAGETTVIPVILRAVDWSGAPFSTLQALPTDAKPITSWENTDEAFANVAKGIRLAVERRSARASLHARFIEAIHGRNLLLLTFFSKQDAGYLTRTCAPLDFGPSRRARDKSDRYHFMDLDSDSGPHVLSLPQDQLREIVPLPAKFSPEDLVTWDTQKSPWFVTRDWGRAS